MIIHLSVSNIVQLDGLITFNHLSRHPVGRKVFSMTIKQLVGNADFDIGTENVRFIYANI